MVWHEVRSALNMAGRGRWSITAPYRTGEYLITKANSRKPYGRALGVNRLTHSPRDILLAWKDGRIVHTKVFWMCGAATYKFILTDKIDTQFCTLCYYKMHRDDLLGSMEFKLLSHQFLFSKLLYLPTPERYGGE